MENDEIISNEKFTILMKKLDNCDTMISNLGEVIMQLHKRIEKLEKQKCKSGHCQM